ncbi:MAG: tetratricopeptide repeat protein [Myxococcota bacterium]
MRAERLVSTGRAFLRAGDPGSALAYFREAIQVDRRFAVAYEELASLYLTREQLSTALEVLRAGLRRRPDHIPLHLLLARALRDQGAADEAIDVLRDLVRQEPRSVAAHAQRAAFARDRGAWAEALSSYRAIVFLAEEAERSATAPPREEVPEATLREAREHVAALSLLVGEVDPARRCGSPVRDALCGRN